MTVGPALGSRVRYADWWVVEGGVSATRRGIVEGALIACDEALVRWDHEPKTVAAVPYEWLLEAPSE